MVTTGSGDEGGLSSGAIAGIVVAGVLVVSCICGICSAASDDGAGPSLPQRAAQVTDAKDAKLGGKELPKNHTQTVLNTMWQRGAEEKV